MLKIHVQWSPLITTYVIKVTEFVIAMFGSPAILDI